MRNAVKRAPAFRLALKAPLPWWQFRRRRAMQRWLDKLTKEIEGELLLAAASRMLRAVLGVDFACSDARPGVFGVAPPEENGSVAG